MRGASVATVARGTTSTPIRCSPDDSCTGVGYWIRTARSRAYRCSGEAHHADGAGDQASAACRTEQSGSAQAVEHAHRDQALCNGHSICSSKNSSSRSCASRRVLEAHEVGAL